MRSFESDHHCLRKAFVLAESFFSLVIIIIKGKEGSSFSCDRTVGARARYVSTGSVSIVVTARNVLATCGINDDNG